MSILNETLDEIDDCLRQSNVSEETGLKILKIEIDEFKDKIRKKWTETIKRVKSLKERNLS